VTSPALHIPENIEALRAAYIASQAALAAERSALIAERAGRAAEQAALASAENTIAHLRVCPGTFLFLTELSEHEANGCQPQEC